MRGGIACIAAVAVLLLAACGGSGGGAARAAPPAGARSCPRRSTAPTSRRSRWRRPARRLTWEPACRRKSVDDLKKTVDTFAAATQRIGDEVAALNPPENAEAANSEAREGPARDRRRDADASAKVAKLKTAQEAISYLEHTKGPAKGSSEVSTALAKLKELGYTTRQRAAGLETGPSGGQTAHMVSAAAARKTVSVLFCDLADSTVLGERLDPEPLRELMGRGTRRCGSPSSTTAAPWRSSSATP